jgi:hypothetical protein
MRVKTEPHTAPDHVLAEYDQDRPGQAGRKRRHGPEGKDQQGEPSVRSNMMTTPMATITQTRM